MSSKVREDQLHVRSEILMAVTMRIAVFLDVTPCSLADRYSHLRGICCFIFRIEDMVRAEKVVQVYGGRHGMGLWVNQQENCGTKWQLYRQQISGGK